MSTPCWSFATAVNGAMLPAVSGRFAGVSSIDPRRCVVPGGLVVPPPPPPQAAAKPRETVAITKRVRMGVNVQPSSEKAECCRRPRGELFSEPTLDESHLWRLGRDARMI